MPPVNSQTAVKRTRQPLTETQRNIRSAERAQLRIQKVRQEQQIAYSQAVTGEEIARARAQADITAQRQRRARIEQPVIRSTQGVVGSTVGPSSGFGSTMLLILFTMAGLILVYLLVTNANSFSGFTKSLGVALSKLTSTEPLFTKVSTK